MLTAALLLGIALTPQALADCDPSSGTDIAGDLAAVLSTERPSDPLQVDRGQVTFDAEGNDDPDSIYFSRRLHWPGGASGVTIGRGYDMRYRTQEQVLEDLLNAGVDRATAEIMSQGAGLSGDAAQDFVRDNGELTISREAQQALFEVVYADYEDMTQSLVCKWTGSSGDACSTLWDGLDPAIQTILVDLRYRGDLTHSRWDSWLDDAVLANDLSAFTTIMSDRDKWSAVPSDRFNRRVDFLEDASSAADQASTQSSTQASTRASTQATAQSADLGGGSTGRGRGFGRRFGRRLFGSR